MNVVYRVLKWMKSAKREENEKLFLNKKFFCVFGIIEMSDEHIYFIYFPFSPPLSFIC